MHLNNPGLHYTHHSDSTKVIRESKYNGSAHRVYVPQRTTQKTKSAMILNWVVPATTRDSDIPRTAGQYRSWNAQAQRRLTRKWRRRESRWWRAATHRKRSFTSGQLIRHVPGLRHHFLYTLSSFIHVCAACKQAEFSDARRLSCATLRRCRADDNFHLRLAAVNGGKRGRLLCSLIVSQVC